jgi:hypothetical protein
MTYDEALAYQQVRRRECYVPSMQELRSLGQGTDATAKPLAPYLCPPCSYLVDGRCVWCPESAEADGLPECFDCHGRELKRKPWYASSEFWIPVSTMVIGSVLSAFIISRIHFGKSKRR